MIHATHYDRTSLVCWIYTEFEVVNLKLGRKRVHSCEFDNVFGYVSSDFQKFVAAKQQGRFGSLRFGVGCDQLDSSVSSEINL